MTEKLPTEMKKGIDQKIEMPARPPSQPLDQSELSYRANVRRMMEDSSSLVFSNGAYVHAAIIYESFFRHAKHSVKLFCQRLAKDVFDRPWLVEAAQSAQQRGINISVIVKERAEPSPFYNWLKQAAISPAVSFGEDINSDGKLDDICFNFATMDEQAYRFEADEKTVKAQACMNAPHLAAQLNELHCRLSAA